MSRSTDTLTKSNVTDYKKMVSNGSIDSMEKSVISESSYDLYDTKNQTASTMATASNLDTPSTPTTPGYNDMLNAKYQEYAAAKTSPKKTQPATSNDSKVYGLPDFHPNSQGFELAYRNEGFRDNSTYGANTRANSISNYLNEDTPIIHQVDADPSDTNSDYYGNSSTLPMRHRGDQLSFLSELKHKLPEYEKLPTPHQQAHSSFLPAPPDPPYQLPSTSFNRGYSKQVNSPSPIKPEYQQPEIRRPPPPYMSPARSTPPPPLPLTDPRRPESYFAAMRSARHSKPPSPPPSPPVQASSRRPKAVYEAADTPHLGDDRRATYSRSKSEALLETNFDDEDASQPTPLTSDSRSYSQPLETAM